METKKIKIETPLRDWMDQLTIVEYYEKRKLIIDKCRISDQVFRHWKNGNSQVHELAKPIINEIAGYEVYKIDEV